MTGSAESWPCSARERGSEEDSGILARAYERMNLPLSEGEREGEEQGATQFLWEGESV